VTSLDSPGRQYKWTNFEEALKPRLGGLLADPDAPAGLTGRARDMAILSARNGRRQANEMQSPLWAAYGKAPVGGKSLLGQASDLQPDSIFGSVSDNGLNLNSPFSLNLPSSTTYPTAMFGDNGDARAIGAGNLTLSGTSPLARRKSAFGGVSAAFREPTTLAQTSGLAF
jgi:hypothetical protein